METFIKKYLILFLFINITASLNASKKPEFDANAHVSADVPQRISDWLADVKSHAEPKGNKLSTAAASTPADVKARTETPMHIVHNFTFGYFHTVSMANEKEAKKKIELQALNPEQKTALKLANLLHLKLKKSGFKYAHLISDEIWTAKIAPFLGTDVVPTMCFPMQSLPEPNNRLEHIAWSPDSTNIATASTHQLNIWNASGQRLHTLRGFSYSAWNPGGTKLAGPSYADLNRTVNIWDAQTGRILRSIPENGHANAIAWSSDGTKLAYTVAEDIGHTVKVINPENGSLLCSVNRISVNRLAWRPKSSQLAISGTPWGMNIHNHSVVIIDSLLERPVHVISDPLPGYSGIHSIAWSPDGKKLAIAGRALKIFDGESAKLLEEYKKNRLPVYDVAWAPDSTKVAIMADNFITIWNVVSRQIESKIQQFHPSSVAWSPDGTKMAVSSHWDGTKIWNLEILKHPGVQDFERGELTKDQTMLLWLLEEFKAKKDAREDEIFKREKSLTSYPMEVHSDLARVISTLHPLIMNAILVHYRMSLEKRSMFADCSIS